MRKGGKPIDLSKILAPYTSGWVALDKNNKVIARAKDFESICKMAKDIKGAFLIPASKNYFGFITRING